MSSWTPTDVQVRSASVPASPGPSWSVSSLLKHTFEFCFKNQAFSSLGVAFGRTQDSCPFLFLGTEDLELDVAGSRERLLGNKLFLMP